MDEKLGWKFWGTLAAMIVGGAIVLLIVLLILGHVFYAWGFFGGLLVFAAILLGVAWIYDRRQVAEYEKLEQL